MTYEENYWRTLADERVGVIAEKMGEIEQLRATVAEGKRLLSEQIELTNERTKFLLVEQHKVKVLTDALESWKGIAENCSIEAGYCCCGEDMKTHSHPMSCGHSPVDMGDGPVSNAMELTYKALATVKGE